MYIYIYINSYIIYPPPQKSRFLLLSYKSYNRTAVARHTLWVATTGADLSLKQWRSCFSEIPTVLYIYIQFIYRHSVCRHTCFGSSRHTWFSFLCFMCYAPETGLNYSIAWGSPTWMFVVSVTFPGAWSWLSSHILVCAKISLVCLGNSMINYQKKNK